MGKKKSKGPWRLFKPSKNSRGPFRVRPSDLPKPEPVCRHCGLPTCPHARDYSEPCENYNAG